MRLEKVQRIASFGLVLALFTGLPGTAYADCDKSEQFRVAEEMNKLATRNAWSGVERNFEKLEKLAGCELSFDQYYLGSQSARFMGKTWEVYQRLGEAKTLNPQDEIVGSLEAIDGAYGRVRLTGNPRRPPELAGDQSQDLLPSRVSMPMCVGAAR